MSQPLGDFEGSRIYVDTMVPYALLRSAHKGALVFFNAVREGRVGAFMSAVAFDELAYRLLLALIRDRYPGSPLDNLRKRQAQAVTEFAPTVATLLARLRDIPHLTIVDVLSEDVEAMIEAMVTCSLLPRDALHLAAMRRTGCLDIAGSDADFDHVPGLRRFTL
jgi:predicted nucleic acid-binding protein